MRSDRIVAVAVAALLLNAAYASQIGEIQLDIWAADSFLTARTLPIVLVSGGVIRALILWLWPESSQRTAHLTGAQVRRLALLVLALAPFAAVVELLGLWIACGLFLLATQVVEGERRPWVLLSHRVGLKSLALNRAEVRDVASTVARGSLLGFLVGVLPGAGATIASFLAYGVERSLAPPHKRAEFGHGSLRGLAAPETANNAACSGAFVPLLTLGIPGSGTTALLMGVLI